LIPNATWRIEGHTDNSGGYEYNKKLSLLRAEAVYNYFISRGLDGNNFEIIGRGEDFPIADNSSKGGRRANRRVVLIRVEQ
jgi:outer membrane protein OmpA-like peptidoglycan-associated protein